MVLDVRSALPPAHSRTEGKQKATTPAPPQVASPQCFQRREALGSFLLLSTFHRGTSACLGLYVQCQ